MAMGDEDWAPFEWATTLKFRHKLWLRMRMHRFSKFNRHLCAHINPRSWEVAGVICVCSKRHVALYDHNAEVNPGVFVASLVYVGLVSVCTFIFSIFRIYFIQCMSVPVRVLRWNRRNRQNYFEHSTVRVWMWADECMSLCHRGPSRSRHAFQFYYCLYIIVQYCLGAPVCIVETAFCCRSAYEEYS